MIRIACLGNSHNAAFKLGWDEIKASYPNVTIDFFSGAATAMKHLEVREGCIFPTKEPVREMFVAYAGRDYISPDYDMYLLVGMGFGLVPLMSLYCMHRPPRLYSRGSGVHLISEELLAASRAALIEGSPAVRALDLVRKIVDRAPVFMVPNPLPSVEILSSPDASHWGNAEVLEDCRAYLDQAISRLASVHYIPQIAMTREGDYFTKPHYTKDARLLKARWTRPTNEGDLYHMNAAYGADFLSAILSRAGVLALKLTDAQTT